MKRAPTMIKFQDPLLAVEARNRIRAKTLKMIIAVVAALVKLGPALTAISEVTTVAREVARNPGAVAITCTPVEDCTRKGVPKPTKIINLACTSRSSNVCHPRGSITPPAAVVVDLLLVAPLTTLATTTICDRHPIAPSIKMIINNKELLEGNQRKRRLLYVPKSAVKKKREEWRWIWTPTTSSSSSKHIVITIMMTSSRVVHLTSMITTISTSIMKEELLVVTPPQQDMGVTVVKIDAASIKRIVSQGTDMAVTNPTILAHHNLLRRETCLPEWRNVNNIKVMENRWRLRQQHDPVL